ncbi:hypothetical protein V496_02424 [Pseudogymnoascus sp. VKM F-4515 (FW-2607)]|nr:hypothetical protein V496_02424 [Pseudogymnoascus sp. VKM F-4515 (FW-2607)]
MSHQTPPIPPIDEAISYVHQIELRFVDRPDIYHTFHRVLEDVKCQPINNVEAVKSISELLAGHPDLLQGFQTYMPQGMRIECGSGNESNNTICATGHQFSLANAGSSVETTLHDQTELLGPEYQANYDPNSTYIGMPAPPMTMFLSVQPPGLPRQLVVLYPPPVVRVLNATMDLEDVFAFASLYRDDGTDASKFLKGTTTGNYSNGSFRFPDLKISENGRYKMKIILWHQNNYLGCVDSKENQHTKQQLHLQDIGGNVKDDENVLGDMKCRKIMVLIPESAFTRGKFDDGLYEITGGLGDGLFTDNCGVWYDDGEVERIGHNLGSSIHRGTDGELYRREPEFNNFPTVVKATDIASL